MYRLKSITSFLILITVFTHQAKSQLVDSIIGAPIDKAVTLIGKNNIIDNITPDVKLVGLGEIAILAKETTLFNTRLAAYLISRRDFRMVVLNQSNFVLRPLNDYLSGNSGFDKDTMDSIAHLSLQQSMYSSQEMMQFLYWLKKHNLKFPSKKISISGSAGPEGLIPVYYFLTHYIYPVDPEQGRLFSSRWQAPNYTDSLSYRDIYAWGSSDKSQSRLKGKNLLTMFNDDVHYNQQVSSLKSYQEAMDMLADGVLRHTNMKTIFFSYNEAIVKSKIVVNGGRDTVNSPGLIFQSRLGKHYVAYLSDFQEVSKTIGNTLMEGLRNKGMQVKEGSFLYNKYTPNIKNYVPRGTNGGGETRTILPSENNNGLPFDGLLVLQRVSSANIIR
ncbi:MAG: hypothetical protein DI598_08600 [Pseudopedobacter saltans]|uniref:Uncharacterized protein n=1 Tax=Pseudopedobacter saltans TaxID=151895 RepID=A0A2W5H064_9SPHI|nr:MAG: hypothetical protein DI598_08600 [Pseudopedobacter saltans]